MGDRLVAIDNARQDLAELLALVPRPLWRRKYEALSQSWPRLNLQGLLRRYHSVELGVGRALETGGLDHIGDGEMDALEQDALIFGHLCMRIARLMPDKRRLIETVKSGLNKSANLRPFLFELETFDTIQQRGFDIIPTDLMGQSRHDFLASKGGNSVAVECKHISGDAGMIIHKSQALEVFDRISGYAIRHHLDITNTLIDIHIPARLDKTIDQVTSLCFSAISNRTSVESELASIRIVPISNDHMDRILAAHEATEHEEERHANLNEILGVRGTGHLYMAGSAEKAVVYSISSASANKSVETIFKRLIADAKQQLPPDLPGALMVEIADLEATDAGFFTKRSNGAGGDLVGEKVEELFTRRPHVLGLCLTAGARNAGFGHPWATIDDLGVAHRPSLIFLNRTHPQYGNAELIPLFGARSG